MEEAEIEAALKWFEDFQPPTAPFRLNKWIHVVEPGLFCDSLKAEIKHGKRYAAYRRVIDDVMALRALFYEEEF